MLSFSTEFPVEEPNATAFCQSVAKWLGGSPHTQISEERVLDVFTSAELDWEDSAERISCILNDGDGDNSAAFRYAKVEEGVEWVTTVCFDANAVDSWVSIRTERNSDTAVAYLPPAKKPFVIRNLLAELHGGLDGELRVKDSPHLLTSSDENMIVRLMNGDAEHHLPFVYLSHPFAEQHFINSSALSRHLGGIAHVLVEPDRSFSQVIKPQVFSQNPYGGYIGVAFPSGDWFRIDPFRFSTEFEARKEIFLRVRDSILNRRPMPRVSWTSIRAQVARKKRKQVDSRQSVDEYAETFDREMEAKDQLLREAEAEISRLRSISMQERKKAATRQGGAFLQAGKEQELEANEFRDLLIDALQNYKNSVESNSRRSHIVEDLLDSNSSDGIADQKKSDIKGLLRGYRNLDSALRAKLEKLGFSITEDGKHYKLTYRNDPRYQYTLSKTASDGRTGLNAATHMARMFF